MPPKYNPPCRQDLWKNEKPPYTVGYHGFDNNDVKKDYDGWVNPEICFPQIYELVHLKTSEKTKPGWWDGIKWEGYRLNSREKVLCWKKFKE